MSKRDVNDRLRDGTLPRDPFEGAKPILPRPMPDPPAADRDPPVPLGRSPLPPFPLGALPPVLRDFAAAFAEDAQVPADVPGLLGLAAVAACVQRRFVVQVRDGYKEPLSLYVAVVLESGERKSACLEGATRPIGEWERAEADRLQETIAEERSRRAAQKKRQERLEDAAARAKDAESRRAAAAEAGEIAAELEATPEPSFPRILADDITPEALARLMAVQGERIAVFSAEGGIFETMAGRYSSGTPNLDVFLKGHAGDWMRIDRRSGPPVVMNAPALTMGLAVQPEVVHTLVNKPGFRGRGLLARFFYALPVSRVGYRRTTSRPMPTSARDAYRDCLRRLLAVPAADDGRSTPLSLSPEALAAFRELADRIERRMRPGADLSHARDWAGKAPGLAVRLAGLMHLAADGSGAIGGNTMRAAVEVVEGYATPHALTAFAEMGADPELDAARAVLEWIRARGLEVVSVREAFNGLRGQSRFARAEAVQKAFDVAEQHGYLGRLPDPPRGGAGRRPSPRYEVRPTEAEGAPQNSQNAQNGAATFDSADSADIAGGVPLSARALADGRDADAAEGDAL